MGDPFSAAAGTAGFVSLGIEVCKGLISYYRAWKAHDREIETALERLTDLERTLQNLSAILSIVETLDDTTSEDLQEAHRWIISCTAALNKLHGTLVKSASINQPAGILDKVHNIRVRTTHFFNIGLLKSLRSDVAETQNNLDRAIQILML